MKHDEIRRLLDDYLDGALSAEHIDQVETHLNECSSCAEEVAGLRPMLAELQALPKAITPSRDLWPELEESLIDTAPVPRESWWSRFRWMLQPAPVAAVALLIVMATMVARFTSQQATPAQVVDVVTAASLEGTIQGLTMQAAGLHRQVASAVRQSQTFPVEAATVLEQDIARIDAAIDEVRVALDANPGSRDLSRLLTDYYMRKLDLLDRMNKMISTDEV